MKEKKEEIKSELCERIVTYDKGEKYTCFATREKTISIFIVRGRLKLDIYDKYKAYIESIVMGLKNGNDAIIVRIPKATCICIHNIGNDKAITKEISINKRKFMIEGEEFEKKYNKSDPERYEEIRVDKKNNKVWKCSNLIARITMNTIEELVEHSQKNHFEVSRICLHKNSNERIQDMIVFANRGQKKRIFQNKNKKEIILLIDGRLKVIAYTNGLNKYNSKTLTKVFGREELPEIYYKLEESINYRVEIMSEYMVKYECATGPYNPDSTISYYLGEQNG